LSRLAAYGVGEFRQLSDSVHALNTLGPASITFDLAGSAHRTANSVMATRSQAGGDSPVCPRPGRTSSRLGFFIRVD